METALNHYYCPKCGAILVPTDDEGLWCENGCYESTFDVWLDMGR